MIFVASLPRICTSIRRRVWETRRARPCRVFARALYQALALLFSESCRVMLLVLAKAVDHEGHAGSASKASQNKAPFSGGHHLKAHAALRPSLAQRGRNHLARAGIRCCRTLQAASRLVDRRPSARSLPFLPADSPALLCWCLPRVPLAAGLAKSSALHLSRARRRTDQRNRGRHLAAGGAGGCWDRSPPRRRHAPGSKSAPPLKI